MLKKTVIIGASILATQVMAQDLTTLSTKIENSSNRISKLAQRVQYGNSNANVEQRLKNQLNKLIQNAKSMKVLLKEDTSPIPPQPAPRPHDPVAFTAKCHIDDDPSLDLNQEVVDVQGSSLEDMMDICEMMAQARHSRRAHSAGITDIKFLGKVKKGMVSAECHVDDDPSLDYNQIIVGTLYGQNLSQVMDSCKMVGEMLYDHKGSAGLQKLNVDVPIPNRMMTGECHIDDDPSFDLNQDIVGVVYGTNMKKLISQCEEIAFMNHGSQSSSAVINIQQ